MSDQTSSSSSSPLSGVRVLDMSRLLPGPFCTQLLCDMGAEVIKVEDPEGGDYARAYPPLMPDGLSAIFHALNRGKRSITMDLKQPEEWKKFLKLVATADVLVETFRPGVLAKLGASPQSLLKLFPHLIICSISGYGQSGPDALRAGHDVNYLAKAGVLGVMARPDLLPVQVADIAGGSYPAAVQILAALRQKEKTGKGAIIDVSMTDNVYSLMSMSLARYSASGSSTPFSGGIDLLSGGTPCYGVYRTKDGWISVGALEPKFWMSFCNAIDLPDLIPMQFPESESERAEVREKVQSVMAKRRNEEWAEFFRPLDCCVEIVELPEGLNTRSPQLAHRGLTLQISCPEVGSETKPVAKDALLEVACTPLRISGLAKNCKPAPQLGEHNAMILSKL